MPTYEYACTACGHDLEAVQSFSDPALTECPVCGGTLRKVFSAVGVVFKGSGFYKTDSRSTSSASSEKPSSDKASSDKASDKAAKPAESKPAAKAESATKTASAPAAS